MTKTIISVVTRTILGRTKKGGVCRWVGVHSYEQKWGHHRCPKSMSVYILVVLPHLVGKLLLDVVVYGEQVEYITPFCCLRVNDKIKVS